MSTTGDIYKAAETGVYQEIVDRFLQPYWNVIAGNGQPLPEAAEFERMAKELVDSRNSADGPQFTLPVTNGGKLVRINEIKEHLARLAGSSNAELLGGFDAVDDIPDRDKVHRLASAVERGIAKGSSWWNVFAADPLGTLIDLIAGFFSGNLSQRMGVRFSRSTSAAVQQELSGLRQLPGMEKFITSERVIQIGERVAQETRRAADSDLTPAPTGIRLNESIRPLAGGGLFASAVEKSIRSLVSAAFKQKAAAYGKSARDTLMEGQTSGWTLGLVAHGALKEHEADAVEKRVADAFVTVITSETYRFNGKMTYTLTHEELKAAVVSEVMAEMRKLHEERGWSYADKRIAAITGALQEQVSSEHIDKMRQASLLSHGQGLAELMPPETKEMVRRERQVQVGQGMSGAHDSVEGIPPASYLAQGRAKSEIHGAPAMTGGSKGY
jgi:hypothetical protein